MSEGTELARREERRPAIEQVLGTGDIRLMVEQARENVNVAIQIARDRGFVTDYDLKDREGNVVAQRAFFHLPTWQLLAQAWGLTAFTEGEPEEIKPGTWRAAAVTQVIEDGRVVGRAVAFCSRAEPGKKFKTDHELAATAQSRAMRNAIRSTLGSLLIAAGVDFPDPDAPATKEQVGMLHQLERELGWTHEQGHQEAGVSSYKQLTREQASELIDRWQQLRAQQGGVGDMAVSGAAAETGEPERPPVDVPPAETETLAYGEGAAAPAEAGGTSPSDDAPATPEQWARALRLFGGRKGAVVGAYCRLFGFSVAKAEEITKGEMAQVIAARMEGRV